MMIIVTRLKQSGLNGGTGEACINRRISRRGVGLDIFAEHQLSEDINFLEPALQPRPVLAPAEFRPLM